MYYIQDAHSFWDWIYFVALIIVSCYANVAVFASYTCTGHKMLVNEL